MSSERLMIVGEEGAEAGTAPLSEALPASHATFVRTFGWRSSDVIKLWSRPNSAFHPSVIHNLPQPIPLGQNLNYEAIAEIDMAEVLEVRVPAMSECQVEAESLYCDDSQVPTTPRTS